MQIYKVTIKNKDIVFYVAASSLEEVQILVQNNLYLTLFFSSGEKEMELDVNIRVLTKKEIKQLDLGKINQSGIIKQEQLLN